MSKFYVDWDNVEPNQMPSLVEAAARYASMNKFACLADVFAILGIKAYDDDGKLTNSEEDNHVL
ncbi:MAG: hypothetical protein SOY03_00570 [Bariatricus sp.]|nr:hypothetical protein [Bariatricus sp.]